MAQCNKAATKHAPEPEIKSVASKSNQNNPAAKASMSTGRHSYRPSQVCVNAFTSSSPLGEGRRKTLVDILHGAASSTLPVYGEKMNEKIQVVLIVVLHIESDTTHLYSNNQNVSLR